MDVLGKTALVTEVSVVAGEICDASFEDCEPATTSLRKQGMLVP